MKNWDKGLDLEFAEKIRMLIFAVQGVTEREWIVTDALRTISRQNELYALGRTIKGKVVTNDKGGQSAHNFGMAVDLAPLKKDSKQVDWNAPREMWQLMADCAVEMGLTAGYYFHTIFDAPHIEDPRWKEQQALWKAGKLKLK